jgi:DNA-binding response OmpR family regulator
MAERTILMIDDESNARKVTKLVLEREGFRVLTAATGEEGLILAKVERPHVILLDVMMPKMNGYETLKRLRDDQDTSTVPVIMITARGTEHDIATSFRLGAVFHIEKPYETQDLLKKITVALTLPGDSAG